MNYRKLLVILVAAGALVLVVMFTLYGRHGEHYRSPYADYLEKSKLSYNGGLKLRGVAPIAGQEQFDEAMEFYATDHFDQAVRLLEQAVRKQPDSATWWMYLGVSYYMQRDATEAVNALEHANQLAQADLRPQIQWYLANARLLAGKRDPAKELLESLDQADGLYASEARNLLAKL
jgi:cytochrome c-type biogenesis protein CcmH/NrfG